MVIREPEVLFSQVGVYDLETKVKNVYYDKNRRFYKILKYKYGKQYYYGKYDDVEEANSIASRLELLNYPIELSRQSNLQLNNVEYVLKLKRELLI